MAVSAKFLADFTDFKRAVDSAELKLTGLRSESGRVERQLQRMGDSFSGKKIFADAELAAKAVKGLGGVSTLTADEQRRLNGIVTEAIAKYKALGQEAPKHLTDIAKATTPINSGFQSILSTLKSIGPALGVGLSVGTVVSFAKGVGEFAGKMVDLNAQTQISTTRLQAFNFAGAGVGLTIDDIAGSADQLAKRIGSGDDSVNSALQKMNLSARQLKDLSLDEVIFKIDDGLTGVSNQFERARILADLFGRSGAQLGRLLDGSLREAITSIEKTGAVIDEQLIRKADEFDDAWAQAWIKFKAYAASALGAAASGVSQLGQAIEDVGRAMREDRGGSDVGRRAPFIGPRRGRLLGPFAFDSALGPSDPVEGSIKDVIEESAIEKELREWAKKTREAAEATASWARNIQGQFLFDRDNAFFNSVTSDATKKLQDLTLRVGKPGILPNLNAGLTSGLIFGPGKVSDSPFGGILSSLNPKNFLGGLTGGFQKLLGGLTGGAGVGGFLSNLGGSLVGGIGNALGGALTGGIGSLIGFATKGLSKLFGGLFGAEGKKTNRERDAAIAQFTGISGDKFGSQDAFRKMATEAGIAASEVDRLFSTGKIKNFQAEFDRMTAKIQEFTSEQEADQERLNAALEKYGLTIEHLGEGEQQKRLNDQAKELIEDWRVLIGAGVEITDVNNAMSDAINEYLQMAVKLGTEVPSAMRPILQKMLEQGTLTDEAGNAITDLEAAGIKFSETMTEGFDKVVKKLEELIEKIGLANVELGSLPSVPSGIIDPNGYSASDVIPMAHGGRGRVTKPTLFLAGEAGPEEFAFSGANERFGRGEHGEGFNHMLAALVGLRGDLSRFTEGIRRTMRDEMLIAMGQRV